MKHYQIFAPMFMLFLVRVDLTDLYPLRIKGKIVRVLDGDTLIIQKGSFRQSLRLSRVDAPELKQPFLGSKESAGVFSKKCLEKLIRKNKEYVIVIERLDIYRRLLGDVADLNLRLIQNGCSGLYPHTQFSSRKEKALFLRNLMKARENRRGLWGKGGIESPKKWRRKSRSKKRA